LFQGRSRATAFACITAGTGAAALTPVPYGIVLDMAGFRVAFLISASFFALLLVLSRTIPDVKGVETLRFDTIGFLLSSGGLFFVLMGVALIPTHGLLLASRTASLSFWGISPCAPLLSIGSGMLFAFIHHEKMREAQGAPALMPSVFFSSAAARHALVAVAFPFFLSGSMNIAVIPFMQMVANATAIESGLLLACAGMPMIALAVGIPRFAPKAPAKAVIRIGYVTGAAGMAVIAWAMARPDPLMLTCIGMLVAGAGMGTVNSQANNAMATAVGEKNAPQSGGIQGTARDIAHSLSTALVGAMLSFFLAHSFGIAIQPAIAIDSTSRLDISSEELTLMDDESFLGMLDTIELDGEAERTVLKAYQDARTHASQLVLMALSAGTICLILFTSGLPSAPLKLPR
ncbi:MAG: hypothetical protein SOU51_00005, partial [Collinsella sp.]|nr:hypothetical protein [Collinsella sp.]